MSAARKLTTSAALLRRLYDIMQVQHRYFLLVILTTSVGDDLEEFRAALMHAAGELALSVIVVGIGSADFGPLEVRLTSGIWINPLCSRFKPDETKV